MATIPFTGRCRCGDIQYSISKAPNWCGHCHCVDCRRQTSSAVATFIGCDEGAFELTGGEFTVYESSPGVRRSFCGRCGTPLAYQAEFMPGEIHILVGTLDDPEMFPPQVEVFCEQRLSWLKLAVDGPSFDRLPETGAL